MASPDILKATELVVKTLEDLGIPYYISGSVASSAYGFARATLDVDLIVDLKLNNVHSLVQILQASYYIDEEMVSDAVRLRSSFNLIHLETMLKIDIFVIKDSLYAREAFSRKKRDKLDEEQSTEYYIASPEDVIINKLEWFRMGGNVSDRQWQDILGIIKVQGDLLDMNYLRYWTAELELSDLLEQALGEAGL
jgi:hypothetical protein